MSSFSFMLFPFYLSPLDQIGDDSDSKLMKKQKNAKVAMLLVCPRIAWAQIVGTNLGRLVPAG